MLEAKLSFLYLSKIRSPTGKFFNLLYNCNKYRSKEWKALTKATLPAKNDI